MNATPEAGPVREGVLDTARLEAFSDGVMAVAITLLALNLAIAGPGHGSLGSQLVDKWPAGASYIVSFFTIGIIWVNHHALFKAVAHVDRTLLFLNLALLAFVVLIPFATSTMATYLQAGGNDAHLAAAIFSGVFEGMSLSFAAIFVWLIRRDHLATPISPTDARRAVWRFGFGNLVYIAGVAVAFISAAATLVLCAVIAIYYVFEQTGTSRSAPRT